MLNRSPKHLLKEVILVDDQSDIGTERTSGLASSERFLYRCFGYLAEMGRRLEEYCDEHFGDLVRILRAPNRLGLIKAKNYGARNGTRPIEV